jgi:hypothetical protein
VKKALFFKFLIGLFLPCLIACSQPKIHHSPGLINLEHLNNLFEAVQLKTEPAAFIYIYADYPDYVPVEAPGEGIACVDDVARAAILYTRHFIYTNDQMSLDKSRKLLQFLLDMQADNGLFYNFIYADYSINKTRKNSKPKAEWWTWRAIWAMAEAYPVFQEQDPDFADQLIKSIERTFPAIEDLLKNFPAKIEHSGFNVPSWLPVKSAADQGAILLLGLNTYYQANRVQKIKDYIQKISDGLIQMQILNAEVPAYSAFRSWPDRWHAWGNSQAHAILMAGSLLEDSTIIHSALKEANNLYPYLQKEQFFNEFRFSNKSGRISISDTKKYPQIAYDIRPMVLTCLTAYYITSDERYARQAGEIACWLLGANAAQTRMYDPLTGRCFDGINNEKNVNKNSGAESTIEALLTLLEVEQNPIAKGIVQQFLDEKQNNPENR